MATPSIFVIRGDLTRLQADAIVYPTSCAQEGVGHLAQAMNQQVVGFKEVYGGPQEPRPGSLERRGDAYWLPLPENSSVKGVVVVATAYADAESIANATARSIQVALEALPVRESKRRIIAFPSLGTGAGGSKHDPMTLNVAQFEAAAAAIDGVEDVDVVMVGVTMTDQRRLLAARAEVRSRGEYSWLEPLRERDLLHTTEHDEEELTTALNRGECVLFLGSGLSIGAKLPNWNKLIEKLIEDVPQIREMLWERALRGLNETAVSVVKTVIDTLAENPRLNFDDYLDVAEWHEELSAEHGRNHLKHIIDLYGAEASSAHPPTVAHYLLMGLPLRIFVTTNYDHLIEHTLDGLSRSRQVIVRDKDVPKTGDFNVASVVKFHGHAAESEGTDAESGGIVLTRSDYRRFFERSPAKAALLRGLLLNHHFFFVGYSLEDTDFRHLHDEVVGMLRDAKRPAFAISLDKPAGATIPHLPGLQPILFEGESFETRVHEMWRWFDHLSEAAVGSPLTFLTKQETPRSLPNLDALHTELLAVGRRAESLLRDGALSTSEIATLEPIFELLGKLGWNPGVWTQMTGSGGRWSALWERMSELAAGEPPLRQRLLQQALSSCERKEQKTRLVALLKA